MRCRLFGGNDRVLWYGYDQAGYLTGMTYFNNDEVEIEPDWRGRIDTIGLEGTTVAQYEYIGSRVAKRTYPSMNSPAYHRAEYDGLGRLENARTNFTEFDYDYVTDTDNIWKRTHAHRSGSPQDVYAYDDLDRLTGVTHYDTTTEGFPIDDLGNRIGNVDLRSGGPEKYEILTDDDDNKTNRYTEIDDIAIGYDAAGNLSVDKDGYHYYYDYENRIIRITDGTNDVAKYYYDALGRRVRKFDSLAGSGVNYYHNANWQVVAECAVNAQGAETTLLRTYVYGNYIDEVLAMKDTGDAYLRYYLHDHLYSPTALLAHAYANFWLIAERYEYDAYGSVHIYTGPGVDSEWFTSDDVEAHPTASAKGNSYLFTGRRLDILDGGSSKIYYYRNRYYDSWVERIFVRVEQSITMPRAGFQGEAFRFSARKFNTRLQAWSEL